FVQLQHGRLKRLTKPLQKLLKLFRLKIFGIGLHIAAMYLTKLRTAIYFDHDTTAISDETWSQLEAVDLTTPLHELSGRYTHHYPICIRKVQPDDTLISMASSDDEPYYAVSFINYNEPNRRNDFLDFADLLARTTALLFDARPHWGKVCPIDAELAEQLYPKLTEFRSVCEKLDPNGVFRNSWINELVFNQEPIATTEPSK
ncbi:MAG: D-arabinono-1,4-lactone oxidase, partial [Phormidesmis sp.]